MFRGESAFPVGLGLADDAEGACTRVARPSSGGATAFLSSKDLAPVMVEQPKPDGSRRPGDAGHFAHGGRDVGGAHLDLRPDRP
jgi:hypothetical protein